MMAHLEYLGELGIISSRMNMQVLPTLVGCVARALSDSLNNDG